MTTSGGSRQSAWLSAWRAGGRAWRGTGFARAPVGGWEVWSADDAPRWAKGWAASAAGFENDGPDWEFWKRDASGTVAAGEVAGEAVVVKQPGLPRGVRVLVTSLRMSRATRTWTKTHMLAAWGLPVERPLFFARRNPTRVLGFARMPGVAVSLARLDVMDDGRRRAAFAEVGRCLRRVESAGWCHLDAKTANWLVDVETGGVTMVDADGVRLYPSPGSGLRRFFKSLARHPQSRRDDFETTATAYAGQTWPRRVSRLVELYGNEPEAYARGAEVMSVE